MSPGHQHLPVLTGDGSDGFPSESDFIEQMEDYLAGLNAKKRAKALMTRDMYATILAVLLDPHSTAHSTAQFRFWAKRMFRLVVTPTANLVAHENRPVAVKDQIYAILVGTHGDVNHGGRDKTSAQVRRFYSWLPKELVSRFVKMCPTCIAKRRQQQPYLSDAFLPANLNLAPRRVQVLPAPATGDSEEDDSPERYETYSASSSRRPSHAQLPPSQPDDSPSEYRADGADDYVGDLQQFLNQYPLPPAPQYTSSSLGEPYPLYYDLDELAAGLPQPPTDVSYALPTAPAALPEAEFYQDENGVAHFYQPGAAVTQPSVYADSQPIPYEEYRLWEVPQVDDGEEQLGGFDGDFTSDPQPQQQYEQPPTIVEPVPHLAGDWSASGLVEEQLSEETFASVYSQDSTASTATTSSYGTVRRAKPPPLDLGKTSNLYPSSSSSLEAPAYPRRSSTTQLLSPSYRRPSSPASAQGSALRSAPLQRTSPAFQYGSYRELQVSPGLASACSTASTVFSAISGGSSMPLTPATAGSSSDSLGLCPPGGEWQQASQAPVGGEQNLDGGLGGVFDGDTGDVDDAMGEPSAQAQLDEAIRQLLLDSAALQLPLSAAPADFAATAPQPQQQQYILPSSSSAVYASASYDPTLPLDLSAADLFQSEVFLPASATSGSYASIYTDEPASFASYSMQQPQQPQQPQQQQPAQQRSMPAPTPTRRPSDRPRVRHASSNRELRSRVVSSNGGGGIGEYDFVSPSKGGRRVVSSALAGYAGAQSGAEQQSGLVRSPTKKALRFMPY
ncbi:hypothetical protein JCM8097_008696 [Rhodosporidiobolus ruineniae]